MKLRILYHHRTQGEEPESIHISEIVTSLRKLGNEVQIVGPAQLRFSSMQTRVPTVLGKIKAVVPRGVFELLQVAYNIVAGFRLARAIKTFDPDVIYERYALFCFVGTWIANKRGIPLLLEVNTPYAQVWARYYRLSFAWLARWLERHTMRLAGHIITVTNVQKKMLCDEGAEPNRISVCHNAIDPGKFCPGQQVVSDLLKAVAHEQVVIGFVGTMNRWQGMEAFPRVLESVLAACPSASFLLVGDGEYRPGLEEFCHAKSLSNRVLFTYRQPHSAVPSLVARMDIAILLDSNAWGSPMKLFEYMAMGKAVIAPRVGPVMEVVEHGKTAVLIDAGNVAQMTSELIRLVNDTASREALGTAARRHVLANHTWDRNAATIESLFGLMQAARLRPQGAM